MGWENTIRELMHKEHVKFSETQKWIYIYKWLEKNIFASLVVIREENLYFRDLDPLAAYLMLLYWRWDIPIFSQHV